MDRRRFVPRPEGLEGRQLLSTATPRPPAAPPLISSPLDQSNNTTALRNIRIDRLPQILARIDPDRVVPPAVVSALQEDLTAIEGKLNRASQPALEGFNKQLRATLAGRSLSVEDAAGLNAAFGRVLDSMGASPSVVRKFRADMNQLAKVDAHAPEPNMTASNDYAFLTQMVIGIGTPVPTRPTPTPSGPVGRGSLGR